MLRYVIFILHLYVQLFELHVFKVGVGLLFEGDSDFGHCSLIVH